MENHIKSWAEVAPHLVAVAAGRSPADMVIRGGKLVNVQTREVLDWQVAIAAGRFAYIGPDASHCIGPDTEVIEAAGRYLIPGLCDGHMHIESGMLTHEQAHKSPGDPACVPVCLSMRSVTRLCPGVSDYEAL